MSLKNICKLLGKEVTENNQMEIYNNITYKKSGDMEDKYKYLFFYEAINENSKASIVAYTKAINYIKRYNKIVKEGTQEEKTKILDELHKTESDLKSIKPKLGKETLNAEEINIVSKFRIKHVMSRNSFSEFYNVSKSSLRRAEVKLESNIVKEKLETLKEYHLTITSPAQKRRR